MVRTEYRNRFNQPKPFHKLHLRHASYQVAKKVLVYDKEPAAQKEFQTIQQ